MSQDSFLPRSLVHRMRSTLLGTVAALYLVTLTIVFFGCNYLIEQHLEKQAQQFLPVFSDLSTGLLTSDSSSDARAHIEDYAAAISEIGAVRIYTSQNVQVAEYRKPGMNAAAPGTASASPVRKTVRVERSAGVAQWVQVIAPIRSKAGNAPVIGYIDLALDPAPLRATVYPGILAIVAAISVLLLIGTRMSMQKMRHAMQPLMKLQEPLQQIADGKFDITFSDSKVDKEVAVIHQALQTTIQAIQEREKKRNEAVQARSQMDQANQSKQAFLANLSHEIHTPMNGVIGMLNLLHDTELTDTQREFAGMAHQSAEKLLQLIDDVLDFSSIGAGRLGLEHIPFDLLHELEAVAGQYNASAKEKGVELTVHYPPALQQHLIGNPARIRQVLTSLVDNAVKFTADGQVDITARSEEKEGICQLTISVSDTGPGLAPDQLAGIFGTGSISEHGHARQHEWTDLDLPACKHLIELMGGEIEVESQLGLGSTFRFKLQLQCATGTSASTSPDTPGMRILFISEDGEDRRAITEQFAQQGLRADGFDTAVAGLSALRETSTAHDPYRIIILDHQMHGIDGETLGTAIKADAVHGDSKLIILSHQSDAMDVQRFAQAGFCAMISKPVSKKILSDVVAALCAALANGKELPFLTAANLYSQRRTQEQRAPSFAGYRVLVADDNIVNQQVVAHMLKKLGCQVDVAADGRKAIDMHGRQHYDMVFMDCEMPDLDGYEAAASIRAAESETHTPIIASTAYAMQGERDKCLTAGMDDFLPKPIRPDVLQELLGRWLKPAPDAEPAAARPVLADELAEMQEMFGADFAALANLFRTDSPQRLAALRTAATSRDAAQVARVAHSLSGSSASIGATGLSMLCKELETLAKAGRLQHVESSLRTVEMEYARVEARLRSMVQVASA